MTAKCQSALTQKDSVRKVSLTEDLDAESRKFAAKMHQLRAVYAVYGLLDGLSTSYSMIRLFFDCCCTNNDMSSPDLMHEWMMTPGGIATAATESITLITFSLLANIFEDDDENRIKRYLAVTWPYVRDMLKGLKNAYKGIRSTFQALDTITGLDLRSMIVPLGLALGAASMVNRCWMRYIRSLRKDMMKQHAKLLEKIKKAEHFNAEKCEKFRNQIKLESKHVSRAMLFCAGYAGTVDGLYLFMGVLGMTALAPPVFLMVSICSVLYASLCVATRVYEEYDFQRKLLGTQAKVELALCGKELEFLLAKLQAISVTISENDVILGEQQKLMSALELKMMEFESKREELRSYLNLSYVSAAFAGLKNGLDGYGAIASMMFAIATINAMFLTPFPAAFLIAGVIAGLTSLIGFMVYSLVKNYFHLRDQKIREAKPHEKLSQLLQTLKENRQEVRELKPTKVKEAITGGMVVDQSPQFFFQEWFEVARSFFSGLSKGQKSVDYTLNPLQELDDHGHYHDTPLMFGVTAFASVTYSLAFSMRAHAKAFGKDGSGSALNKTKTPTKEEPTQDKIAVTSKLDKVAPVVFAVEEQAQKSKLAQFSLLSEPHPQQNMTNQNSGSLLDPSWDGGSVGDEISPQIDSPHEGCPKFQLAPPPAPPPTTSATPTFYSKPTYDGLSFFKTSIARSKSMGNIVAMSNADPDYRALGLM